MEGDSKPDVASPEEIEKLANEQIEKNIKFVRSGLFEATKAFMDAMQDAGTVNRDLIALEGAIEFAVKFWDDFMLEIGHTPGKSRAGFMRSVNDAFSRIRKERKQSDAEADATKGSD